MILGKAEILKQIKSGDIVIEPFNEDNLGPNSYDVTLSPLLGFYAPNAGDAYESCSGRLKQPNIDPEFILDCGKENEFHVIEMINGYADLYPNIVYLASTNEYTESHESVPFLNGKSSLARLGLAVHQTAGWGDIGFCGNWTLELTVAQPLRIYANMPIGQIVWQDIMGVDGSYGERSESKYNQERPSPTPVPSKMWKNKFFAK